MTVVTLTLNPTIDISMEVDEMVPDHKLRARLIDIEPGGGGVNVSRVLHRLGVPTRAVVALGSMSGEILRAELAAEGVPIVPVSIHGATRRAATIFASRTREHYRLVTEGHRLDDSEWQAARDALAAAGADADYLVLSGSFPPGVPVSLVNELAVIAREVGARLVVDSSGAPLAAAADAGVFLLKPNRRELQELVGAPEEFDVVAAARRLVDRRVAVVVVSLGADGALLVADGTEVRLPTVPVDVVSAVGAGDSMVGGILAGLVEGRPLDAALRLGMAAGAAACLTDGSGLCREEDVRRLDADLANDDHAG
jgi:6-phosphofructokinase 2